MLRAFSYGRSVVRKKPSLLVPDARCAKRTEVEVGLVSGVFVDIMKSMSSTGPRVALFFESFDSVVGRKPSLVAADARRVGRAGVENGLGKGAFVDEIKSMSSTKPRVELRFDSFAPVVWLETMSVEVAASLVAAGFLGITV